MEKHKKDSKDKHAQIKKKKKTIELYKEKVEKLIVEKEALESKNENMKNKTDEEDDPEIAKLNAQIVKEIQEKEAYDEKISDIKADFLAIKSQMGGLNATQQKLDFYEKHIKSLESRLDKANQKFNETIEYDKKLRAEIDKLRKERFFFENIYKKLEKELEKVRNQISKSLKAAYENYEARDANQEKFESLKAQMLKTESEYVNILQDISNKQNIRDSRKKSMEKKEAAAKTDELSTNNAKTYSKIKKSENADITREKQIQTYNSLKYKFEKLAEFTGHQALADITSKDNSGVDDFCNKFKEDDAKNFKLFLAISSMSSEAKLLESEINDMENEIEVFKKAKNSQRGLDKQNLLSELKTKTQKLIQQADKYESDYKVHSENFQKMSDNIKALYDTLDCDDLSTLAEKEDYKKRITEENALDILSKVEFRLKSFAKILEFEKKNLPGDTLVAFIRKKKEENKKKEKPKQDEYNAMLRNPKELREYMHNMYLAMDDNKEFIDAIKNIKTDEFKVGNFIQLSEEYKKKVEKELYDKYVKEKYQDKKPEKKGSKRPGGGI
ncbi:MAG: hypothetical protein MJ252_20085 [archaeon]|nr:hypothetical protein [archaeon]